MEEFFRTVLTELGQNIRPSDVKCLLLTLTATCPSSATKDIAGVCGVKDWCVVRSINTQKNIRYAVKDVTEENISIVLVQQLHRV